MLNVILLGLVSFFSDISSEMVYPLIPLYLSATLGATPVLIGIIEGIAESLASLLKVFSGYFTDRTKRKKPVAAIGYSTGIVYKLALVLSSSWGGILVARIIDRMGKGIRTAPRDVLVAESADKNSMGGAFGIHKALDMAGSAVGIIASYFLLSSMSAGGEYNFKSIFWLSIIPAVIGLAMFAFVKEKKTVRETKVRERFWKKLGQLDSNLKIYLVITFIFTLGNSSNSFLLLKAKDVGFNDMNVVLLYFAYNITTALLSLPFGKLSDKIGRRRVLVAGYTVFAAVYFGFAFATSKTALVFIFIAYGFYTAMTAGVERAFIAEISPPELKGTMLGLQATLVGIALLPASIIAGGIWYAFSPAAAFIFGGSLSLISALALMLLLKNKNPSRKA